jgi:hypothetical protein
MWDFVMDESGAGAGFLRELHFPLPIYIPSASPQSSLRKLLCSLTVTEMHVTKSVPNITDSSVRVAMD